MGKNYDITTLNSKHLYFKKVWSSHFTDTIKILVTLKQPFDNQKSQKN